MLRCGKHLALVLALSLAAPVVAETKSDPWEGYNRTMYDFNKSADRYLIKPLAQGYQAVTPDLVEQGVHNFFSNLGDITSLVNSINSTFGLAGVIDVSTPMGLPSSGEDFGQTLGYWGVSSGPYLVLPLFGPSSVRDAVGRVPDTYTDVWPVEVGHIPTRNSGYGLRLLDTRVSLFSAERLISGDEYSFVRDAYLQQRAFMVKDGQMDLKFNQDDF